MMRRPPRYTLFPSPTLFRSSSSLLGDRHRRFGVLHADLLHGPRDGRVDDVEHRLRVEAERDDDGDERRSEEHTSELQSRQYLVCRLLLEKITRKHISTCETF